MEFPRMMYHQELGAVRVENLEDFEFRKSNGWSPVPLPPVEKPAPNLNPTLEDVTEIVKAMGDHVNRLGEHVNSGHDAVVRAINDLTARVGDNEALALRVTELENSLGQANARIGLLESAVPKPSPIGEVHPAPHVEPAKDTKKKG